ncbi:MAG: glycosyltransferase family 9 protein [Candidatus Binatia bacterium]
MEAIPERILVVLLGAIGDVVRAMPLVWRVRRAFPRAHLAWAVEPIAAPLLEGHPAIDERIVFDRPRGARAFPPFLGEIRRRRFDLVLDLQRHLKSGLVSRASGAPRRIGFARANTKEGNWLFNSETIAPQEHFSSKLRQYLAFADHLGLPPAPIEFGLRGGDAERARATAWLESLGRAIVAAFVGSTWPSRFWTPEATAEVLTTLAERDGFAAVLLGGRGETSFAREVAARAPAGTVDLVGKTSLRDLVAIFERSRLAFGPDSGPMHIAAAVGVPVVSLWGATSAERSAPWGSEDLAVSGVVACHPCYLRRCPVDRLCMRSIRAEEIVVRLEGALAR